MNDLDTRKKIINSGIKLFALKGYHNTSIREITKEANSNIASINYHFGSKKNLVKSIIEEIVGPINELRLEKLQELLNKHRDAKTIPSTKDIIRIFIEPALVSITCQEEGFLRHQVIVRVNTSSDEEIKKFFSDFMKNLFHTFLDALYLANPNTPKEELTAKLFFSIGSLHHCIFILNSNFPFDDWCMEKLEPKKNIEVLIDYICKGFQ